MEENLYTPNSIRTVSGRYINVIDPDPESIIIEDIAHGLSMTPRFGGHLPRFYSVAQHSIGVANCSAPEHKLQALMHDASDYIIGDMPSPIKQHLPDFQRMEERLMQVIAKKFGFPWPMHADVKTADRAMLEAEWDGLMLGKRTDPFIMSCDFARDRFLELFHELTGQPREAQPVHHHLSDARK